MSEPGPLPICAKCNKPVDDITRVELDRALVFTVHCHGEVETTTITAQDMIEMGGPSELQPGRAFVGRLRLERPPERIAR